MSTAMQGAYAELYPDVYGKLAPRTEQLLADAGHTNTVRRQHQDDRAKIEINGLNKDMKAHRVVEVVGEGEKRGSNLNDFEQREQEALAENKALQEELKKLNYEEKQNTLADVETMRQDQEEVRKDQDQHIDNVDTFNRRIDQAGKDSVSVALESKPTENTLLSSDNANI